MLGRPLLSKARSGLALLITFTNNPPPTSADPSLRKKATDSGGLFRFTPHWLCIDQCSNYCCATSCALRCAAGRAVTMLPCSNHVVYHTSRHPRDRLRSPKRGECDLGGKFQGQVQVRLRVVNFRVRLGDHAESVDFAQRFPHVHAGLELRHYVLDPSDKGRGLLGLGHALRLRGELLLLVLDLQQLRFQSLLRDAALGRE